MILSLGRLEPVKARDVWPHEALDFTPWLLANVDVLSDLLGMDLVLETAEHPVGNFSLDLIGRDESTDERVIVENQLELSDHTHLGQIITYAAGTDPTTIVWITTGFRPEHRAAIDWLNERTDENTRVFGVVINVVRIGDSAVAPNFELVAQPNDWEKTVRRLAQAAGEDSGKALEYQAFWEQFLAYARTEGHSWLPRGGRVTTHRIDTTTGVAGVVISMQFRREGLVTQIIFNGPDAALNTRRFDDLHAAREAFEKVAGPVDLWDPMEQYKAARVVYIAPYTSPTDSDSWAEMNAWLIERQNTIRKALITVRSHDLWTQER